MGTDAENHVAEAIAYLDKNCKIPNWRNKVVPSKLQMNTFKNCILGQVYGDYYVGKDILIREDRSGWTDEISIAFSDYAEEWIAAIETTLYDNNEWRSIRNHALIVKVVNVFTLKDVKYITLTSGRSGFAVLSETEFNSIYEPKPAIPYVEGQLYKGREAGTKNYDTFMFSMTASAARPGFYRLGFGTHGSIEYMERNYGPLTPVKAAGGFNVKATIQS